MLTVLDSSACIPFALLPCTVLAGDVPRPCISDEREKIKLCALQVWPFHVTVYC